MKYPAMLSYEIERTLDQLPSHLMHDPLLKYNRIDSSSILIKLIQYSQDIHGCRLKKKIVLKKML